MTTKADLNAAERLLKKAVRVTRDEIAAGDAVEVVTFGGDLVAKYRTYDRAKVVAMLTSAGESAALLYGESA